MSNRTATTIFAATALGFAAAGGFALATVMQPATFPQRWEISNDKSLAETAAMRDGLHNRALEILRTIKAKEYHCVEGDCNAFESCVAFKSTPLAETTCAPVARGNSED